MPFSFSEQHAVEYFGRGYTIFRQILPSSLVRDLRAVCEQAEPFVKWDEGAPKLTAVGKLSDKIDLAPFRAYKDLPALNDAFQKLLSPQHAPAAIEEILEVFYQPKDEARSLKWHRDIKEDGVGLDPAQFRKLNASGKWFVKVNAALYPDPSLFYVPSSLKRGNLPIEEEVAERFPLRANSKEQWEEVVSGYVGSMPGAEQVFLGVGDVAVYQPNAFHLGAYWPSVRRATLQDTVWTAEIRTWFYDYMGKR